MKKMKNNVLMLGITALSVIFATKVSAQAPTAAFSLSQSTVCVGDPVQITDVSTDSPTAWSYTIEGTTAGTSTLQNPSATFTAAGLYNITLEATNGIGTSVPYTTTISVNALPNVTTGSGSALDVCAGSMVTLSGSGASSYTWTGGVSDGVSFAPTASAEYTVTGTDVNGCKNSTTQSVTVNSLPAMSISGAGAVCVGSSITLTVTGADIYTWTGMGSNSDIFTDSPSSNLTYTVVGTNTTTGCSNMANKAITVNSLPTIIVNNGSVCSGNAFIMNPSGASTYVYSSGSQTVSPSVNTTYTVTGTDVNGCSASAVSAVTVFALPVITVNSGSICAGSSFTMIPGGALTYSYSGGSDIVSPVTNTFYTVTGADANNCVSTVISNVTVSALPVVSVNSGTICSGDMFTMNPTGASTYVYSNGSNTVSPVANTSYTVTGTDAMGCVSNPVVSSVTVFALPVVSVNSGVMCSGGVFTMVPSGATTYTYSNGTATVSPVSNASYSVTGTSAQGCVSSNVAVSNVTVLTLPVVSVTSGTVCQGGIYTMTASGAATYVYSNGSQTVNPSVTTSYSVTGIDSYGCSSSNTAVATVTVFSLPTLSILSNTAICSGQNATLTVSGANSYVWNTTSTVATIVVSPLTNTSYSVIGTDANGCLNMTAQLIVVNPLPTVTVNSGAVCPGGSFTLTPSGALTYIYSSGSPVVMPTSSTTYSVVGTDANGCVSANAVSTVNVVNALTITVSGNTTICNGQTANLTANGATTYSWSTNASGSVIAVSPSGLTSYTVTGTSSNCSNSTVVSVSVNPLPNVSALSTSTLICSGETATLTAQGAISYQWMGGTSATNSLIVSPTTNATYTVTGTDANSCSNSAVITQSVSDCVGLNKIANNTINVSVYPNPNNGDFTIAIANETSVKILNGIGQVVFAANLTQGDNSISLSNQPKGIYFVQLKQGEEIKTLKVVKN